MDRPPAAHHDTARYRLRFRSMFNQGKGYLFPCDEDGRVDMSTLSEGVRNNYLYARALVGRDFFCPAVESGDPSRASPGHYAPGSRASNSPIVTS